VLFKITH